MLCTIWCLCNVFVKMAASFVDFPVDLFATNAVVTSPGALVLSATSGSCAVYCVTHYIRWSHLI